ncbi:hypothetical protein [Baekduia sp. Peel2402]|uniref:hypothetical protein n=1 Tax=Baekduia sp. Peel2402 TaxID=3458296 RepID=UPI00403E9884
MNRMRVGEWVAAAGAVALLVLMFFDWYAFTPVAEPVSGGGIKNLVTVVWAGSLSGWGTLGWFMDTLVGVLIFGGLALSYMTVKRASPAWPVGAGVLTWIVGSLIFLILLVRVTIAQPGVDENFTLQAPAYFGLVAAFLIPLGAFLSIRDERTASAEARAYTPPPPRSVPGT